MKLNSRYLFDTNRRSISCIIIKLISDIIFVLTVFLRYIYLLYKPGVKLTPSLKSNIIIHLANFANGYFNFVISAVCSVLFDLFGIDMLGRSQPKVGWKAPRGFRWRTYFASRKVGSPGEFYLLPVLTLYRQSVILV